MQQYDHDRARRCSFTIGAVLMISIGFVSITTNPYVATALMSIGGFAHQTLVHRRITMSADRSRKMRSFAVGLADLAAWMGQLSFNPFMGHWSLLSVTPVLHCTQSVRYYRYHPVVLIKDPEAPPATTNSPGVSPLKRLGFTA